MDKFLDAIERIAPPGEWRSNVSRGATVHITLPASRTNAPR